MFAISADPRTRSAMAQAEAERQRTIKKFFRWSRPKAPILS